jgi:hypothetical protein
MNQFTFDCRQLDQVDFANQPPVPLRTASPRNPLPPNELAALKSALRFGKAFSPSLGTAEEIVDIASKPVAVRLLTPAKMPLVSKSPVIIKFSSSTQLTLAGAFAYSAIPVPGLGVLASLGLYASTTREVGCFATLGGGIFINTPGASLGEEVTLILGTPADFSGPYFGIGVGVGVGVTVTETLLFSPTLPLTIPLTLTLMGFSFNLSASTPTKLPVTVSIEVTNTKIRRLKKF